MKNLIIVGARGFGREIYSTSFFCHGYNETFSVKGFLDDKKDALDYLGNYPPIIDSVENYVIQENDVFICALGSVYYKKKYSEILLEKGGQFINLIHKQAYLSDFATIGKGNILFKDVSISNNVRLGDFNTLHQYVTTGHDTMIGNFTEIETSVFLGGSTVVEDMVTLHTGAIIMPHVKIENNATVGAGSVVIRKVKSGTTVFGNPAKILKY